MGNDSKQYEALRERVKELTCLYGLMQLAVRPGMTAEDILRGTVALLPPAWQYPAVTAGRIVVDDRSYVTANFRETAHMQSAPIVVRGKRRGSIDVVYVEERPALDEGPFLKEERSLLNTIAQHVALIVARREADDDRLRLQEQLRHAERLATVGQLAAGVAHELNEPLGNILGFAQLARKVPGLAESVVQDLGKIVATSLHARQIINNLMLFSRQMPPQKTRMDPNTVVQEGLDFLESRCAKNGITVVRQLSPDLPQITADASQLRQVFVNLVVNAIYAMPEGGTLTIATRASGDRVVLRVGDTGTGMSAETLKQIFVPFFTTKDVDEGTGLGLPVVHGIVTSHGGTIHVESSPGRGARFDIEIPIAHDGRIKEDRTDATAQR